MLKGATLFSQWFGKPHRATKDLDLLGRGSPDIDRLTRVFRDVVGIVFPEDGLTFDAVGIRGTPIREDALYGGTRIMIPGTLGTARFKVQVDVGTGDRVVPPPLVVVLTPILDMPSPRIQAYAKETVVAEKLEALVVLSMATSQMKDLYDLDLLRHSFEFDEVLVESVRWTFSRRGTPIPQEVPLGLSEAFALDTVKRTQWKAFLRKAGGQFERDLGDVVRDLRVWLWPVLKEAGVSERHDP